MSQPTGIMGLLNRNGTYYAEFYDANKKPKAKRFSLRTKRKDEARRRLVELENDWEQGIFDPWSDDPRTYKETPDPKAPLTICEAADQFLARKRKDGRTENTLRTYNEILSLLQDAVGGGLELRKLKPSHIEAFIREPSLSDATKHKRFGHLRTFLRWAAKESLLNANPLDDVEPPRKPHKLPKAVTEAELEAICEAVLVDYKEKKEAGYVQDGELIWRIPIFRFAYYTGMRGSEIGRLRWRDIDFEKRLIYIRKQKNRKEQTIPLNTKAAEIIEALERGEADDYVFRSPSFTSKQRNAKNFVNRVSEAFRGARRDAGIKRRVPFHGLRHGFCTRLAEAGKPLYVIKEAARHADVSTSLIYVHMANEHLKSELDDVFG